MESITQDIVTVSNNILSGAGRLKWCVREAATTERDTGWVFLSEIDSDSYLADVNNLSVTTFDSIVETEPAILLIRDFPQGTDIQLVIKKGKRFFVDSSTGKKIAL